MSREALEAGYSVPTTADHYLGTSPCHANDNVVQQLPLIDPNDWHGLPIPERKWILPGFIPDRQVTLFSGEDGMGKSLAALLLMMAKAFGTEWLGQQVAESGGMYFGVEDEVEELHIRIADILRHGKRTFADLAGRGVRLISMADRDAILAEPDKSGGMLETGIFPLLKSHIESIRPKLIIIDTSADAFGGDEITRKQVRAFVSSCFGYWQSSSIAPCCC